MRHLLLSLMLLAATPHRGVLTLLRWSNPTS
jgi:hypothetical protein